MDRPAIAMLTSSELNARPDFALGGTSISPAMRTIAGPAGTASIEPRVLQVLVVLADAAGEIVTRETLFARCWGSAQVGDDSLNRAVAAARKALAAAGESGAEIETITRTGYRLVLPSAEAPGSPAITRRRLVVGAGAGVAVLAGVGLWTARSREQRSYADLMRRGHAAIAYDNRSVESAAYFRRALAVRQDDPAAQGLLAYAQVMRLSNEPPGSVGSALEEAEQASRLALAAEPDNPDARLAQLVLQRPTLDFATTEDRLRAILASHPDHLEAMRNLWNLLQIVGRSSEAAQLNQRAMTLAPISAMNNFPKAQLLWILGQTAEADRVIDQAMRFWPEQRFVRFARFIIYAFTGRARAAKAMLDDPAARPQTFAPDGVALWRINLAALDDPSPVHVAAAVNANRDAAGKSPALASQAILTLPVLDQVDAAFEAASTLFAGPAAGADMATTPSRGTAWKFAPFLFTPPTAALRADPRFALICDASGLTDYWRRRGILPDYQRA